MKPTAWLLALGLVLGACERLPDKNGTETTQKEDPAAPAQDLAAQGETNLKNIRQLTNGGENAEAYWSFDETKLIFQSTRPPYTADQIYIMDPDGSKPTLVSTGKGRTTCAYFLPGDKKILYASTHAAGDEPPAPPDRSKGYVWPIFKSYDIYIADADGKNPINITQSDSYDAEATVSPAGDKLVFTSTRDGDIELYSMNLDGTDLKRLTNRPGYDGGAFFSWDGKKIVWRAPGQEGVAADYHDLLQQGLVRPSKLEIWIMDADGSNKVQLTTNGKANFGPFWHPDGRRIIFATNVYDPKGTNFDLALVDIETKEVTRVTYFSRKGANPHRSDDFDGFPMFSRDGKRLVWCSNRNNAKPYETNVFVADWVD